MRKLATAFAIAVGMANPAYADDLPPILSALVWKQTFPECDRPAPTLDTGSAQICSAAQKMREFMEHDGRKSAITHSDPGAISICPPPYRMTARDGCQ